MLTTLVRIPARELTKDQLRLELTLRLMNSRGLNKKTGSGTYNWSITPGKSCGLGITKECWSKCYARRLAARRPNVAKAWARCLELAKHPHFAGVLPEVLSALTPGILRLHVAGDFFDTAYLTAWINAIQANTHLKPFAFTRTWRDPRIRRTLARHGWPHWILASTDSQTGPHPRQMREAHMDPTSLRKIRAGTADAPAALCAEQGPGRTPCDQCGACPAVRWGKGQFVPLKTPEPLITFASH